MVGQSSRPGLGQQGQTSASHDHSRRENRGDEGLLASQQVWRPPDLAMLWIHPGDRDLEEPHQKSEFLIFGKIGCWTLNKEVFVSRHYNSGQFAAGHYNHYYNISSSNRYKHIYKRQVYPYPFKMKKEVHTKVSGKVQKRARYSEPWQREQRCN